MRPSYFTMILLPLNLNFACSGSGGGKSNPIAKDVADAVSEDPEDENTNPGTEDGKKTDPKKDDKGDATKAQGSTVLSGLINNAKWTFVDGMVLPVAGSDLFQFQFFSRKLTLSECASRPTDFAAYGFGKRALGTYTPGNTSRLFVIKPAKNTGDGKLQVQSIKDGYVVGQARIGFTNEDTIEGSFKLIDCTEPPVLSAEETCLQNPGYEFKDGKCSMMVPKLAKLSDFIGSFSADTGHSESSSTTNPPLLKLEAEVVSTKGSGGTVHYKITGKATQKGFFGDPTVTTITLDADSDDKLTLQDGGVEVGKVGDNEWPYKFTDQYKLDARPSLWFEGEECNGDKESFVLAPINVKTGEFIVYFKILSDSCSRYYFYGAVKKQS